MRVFRIFAGAKLEFATELTLPHAVPAGNVCLGDAGWGVLWGIVSLGFMAAGIVAGLAVFKEDFAVQEDMAKSFLPTRT